MRRFLAVCTGNTCRSPMFAALLADACARSGTPAVVDSAGIDAAVDEPASAGALAAMARRGLDLSAHRSRPVTALDLSVYDHVYTVGSRHAAHLRSLGVPAARLSVLAVDRGGVPDPWGGDDAAYEAAAVTLAAEADRIAAEV